LDAGPAGSSVTSTVPNVGAAGVDAVDTEPQQAVTVNLTLIVLWKVNRLLKLLLCLLFINTNNNNLIIFMLLAS